MTGVVSNAAANDHPTKPNGSGFYVSAGYAMVYSPDETLAVTDAGSTNSGISSSALLDYDLGFRSTTLSAGYGFANGLRAELEAGYRRNELEIIDYSDSRGRLNTGYKDSVDAFTGFANLYYEFDLPLAVRPYLGAGIGLASVGYKGNFVVRNGFNLSESPLFDERDSAFAWQVIAGASIPFTRRTRLSAEYRYWQTADVQFTADQDNFPGAPASTYRTRHKLHMAGLQLQFFPAKQAAAGANGRTGKRARTRRYATDTDSPKGVYATAHFGVAAAEDSDIKDSSADTNFDAFDLGPAGGLAIGYQWTSKRGWPMRAELEASRFSNPADLVDFGKLSGEDRLRGDATSTSVAVNVLFERARRPGLKPYAGIGFGYADVDYDVQLRLPQANPANPEFLKSNASSPLVQGMLGVQVGLTRKLSANLGYRYWWAPFLRLTNPAGERVETEHSIHMVQLGLQWQLR